MRRDLLLKKAAVLAASMFVLAAFFIIYGPYFPAKNGTMGDDYQQQLPNLLSGYYWFLANGVFSVPWFTPAQCGGIPFFADPGHGFFSLPTYLTIFLGPLFSVKITFILFALLGYVGFYFLLRASGLSRTIAVAGSSFFALNGFYAYRVIIGHPFHAFMLIPFVALIAISGREKLLLKIVMIGLIFAYMFHSAMLHIMPPAFIALAAIVLIYQARSGFDTKAWVRLLLGVFIGVGLSLSKISAAISFLGYFPRDFYALPGFPSILNVTEIAIKSLFFKAPTDQANNLLSGAQFYLQQHEFEFGITPAPLALMIAGLLFFIYARIKKGPPPLKKIIPIIAISLLLAIPIILNWYSPSWNSLLKKLPLVGQSSSLIRWFSAYIPVFALLGALGAESVSKKSAARMAIAITSVIFTIGYQASYDKIFYNSQHYNPEAIETAYKKAKQTQTPPSIDVVGAYLKQNGEISMPVGRNDVLTQGASQLACYNAIFGYRLEKFPRKDLTTGSVFDVRSEHLNIKNPACYLFAKENNCAPGDHFRAYEREKADAFVHYKPFEFRKSLLQKIADAINAVFLLFCAIVLALETKRFFKPRVRLRKQR